MMDPQPDGDRAEFSIRGVHALARAINNDPALVEKDWREPFLGKFEMTAAQRKAIDGLPADHVAELQQIFMLAAQGVRQGRNIELRVVSDLTDGERRRLQLRVPIASIGKMTFANQKVLGPDAIEFPIVCCCADCSHWHWCGDGNPCI